MTETQTQTEVVCDPEIMFGKPTIRGTRLTVEHTSRRIGAGWTIEELLDQHPHLTREGIRAAAAYAADHLRDTRGESTYDAAE